MRANAIPWAVLLAAGPLFVLAGIHAPVQGAGNRWNLATADTEISIGVVNNQPIVRRLENPVARRNWADHGMNVPLMSRVWRDGREVPTAWSFQGAAVTLADPLVSDALAGSVDFLWIDLEHAAMSPDALSGHLLAARGRGIPALVRVAAGTTPLIKPVLDAGAPGIIVLQVRTAEEVRQAVGDCRYPPLGRRGYGPRVPSDYGRDAGREYAARANRELFVAVQIEKADALAAPAASIPLALALNRPGPLHGAAGATILAVW
jgi:hypothetical protein